MTRFSTASGNFRSSARPGQRVKRADFSHTSVTLQRLPTFAEAYLLVVKI